MNTKIILLVEDELLIAIMQTQQLEAEGYTVMHASNGKEALEIILKRKEKPDLILMDIDLGSDLDGTQTAQEIAKYSDIPVLFLSSHTERETVKKTEKITSYGYVVKNSGITVLDASIKMAFKLYEANRVTMRQREHLGAILYSIGDAVIATDEKEKVISMNPVAETLTGWTFQEANGRNLGDIFHIVNSVTRKKVESPVKEVLATGKIVGLANHTVLISKTGGEYQIADSGSPIIEVNGTVAGVVLVFRDVTNEYNLQRQIEESEKKYSVLFNKSGIPACLTKLPENTFADINEEFENIFGYKKEEVIGKTSIELGLIKPDQQTPILESLKHANEISQSERRVMTKSGEERIVSIYITKIELNQTSYAITTLQDITDRKRHEEEKRKSLEKITAQAYMLASVNDAVIATDTSFHINYWNLSAEKIYGWKENEVIGKYAPDILQTEYINKVRGDVIEDIHKKGSFFGIVMQKRKDNTQIFIEANMVLLRNESEKITGYLSVSRDVTERILAEQKHEYAENRFHGIVASAMDAVVSINEEHDIVLFNKAAEDMFGYTTKEILGEKLDRLIPFRFRKNHSKQIQLFAEGGISQRAMGALGEIYGLRANGEEFPIEASISQVKIGKEILLTAILRDISARKQVEEEIERLLKEKEIILKEVHHRVKNNMYTILSLLTIQANSSNDTIIQGILLNAGGRIRSMMLLYDKLYRSENNNALSMKDYLPSLISEIINVLQSNNKITIQTEVEDVTLSPKKLSPIGIILNELITNSMKYAFTKNKSGIISVVATRIEEKILIHYHDNGEGIPSTISPDNSEGFGLKLISLLIKQLHGTFRIQRENGTSVYMEFEI